MSTTVVHGQESTTAVRKKHLLLLLLACCCCLAAAAGTERSDGDAIADLARSLANPPPSWTAGGDACSSFKGISCSPSGRVTAIDLAGMGLAGTLPSSLSSLTALQSLQLAGNALSGVVPPGLGKIPTLRNVSLSGNYLQGPAPRFAVGVATDVVVAGNGFCHDEPGRPCDARVSTLLKVAEGFGYPLYLARSWKGNEPCERWYGVVCYTTPDVVMLLLDDADLSGTISPAIANLTGLQRLGLSDNNLTGQIPESLTTLTNLDLVDVRNNSLSGQLPRFKPSVLVLSDGNRFGGSSSGAAAVADSGSSSSRGSAADASSGIIL
ncbi:unnamed protein product [Urochloa humidicola]